jgi:hypothetical protein
MEFVDYKVKHSRFILTKPVPCLLKDSCFDAAHQHYVEHRVVRYENVGGMVLHVPPRPHLAAVNGREEAGCSRSGNKLCVEGDALEFRAQAAQLAQAPSSRDWRTSSIAPKIDGVSVPVRLQPASDCGGIQAHPHPAELVFD